MTDRRRFLKRSLAGVGAVVLGGQAVREFVLGADEPGLGVGFRNDAPDALDAFARPAEHVRKRGREVQCVLCPHACILGENDRGFCRVRIVKNGTLYTLGYGNLCSMALDPIEKKPLYHYLPRTPILSVAHGGCNLRCLNCQNWEISQARPHDVAQYQASPAELVGTCEDRSIRALAFTYSEPLMTFEYVRDTSAIARERGIRTVLVTAGYINPEPLRALCRVTDAVTLDVKAFRDSFYRQVSSARLVPVLKTLEIFREEGVWVEVSFLVVPTLSDDPAEIGRFAGWVARTLGVGTPFHILRFRPAHRLRQLPPTSLAAMDDARRRALDAGLTHVYLGNVPGHEGNHTWCGRCGRKLIERQGFAVVRMDIANGKCPCGEPVPGVFS